MSRASREQHPLLRCARSSFLLSKPELLRAVHPTQLLHNFAEVLSQGVVVVAATEGASSAASYNCELDSEHALADSVFNASQQVDAVDVFVSYVWSTERWLNALALYYYMNIESAVTSSVATWTLLILCVIVRGPTAMGGEPYLLHVFLGLPMTIFVLAFFFGHHVRVAAQKIWIDKVCIHQTRLALKMDGVSALPEVVAKSERLALLWSSSYFERLWCNAEIATFVASQKGPSNIDVVPLWLAPWVIVTVSLEIVSIVVSNRLFIWITTVGDYLVETALVDMLAVRTFLSLFIGVGASFSVAYMPLVPFTWYSLRKSVDIKETMVSQCEHYTLDKAKCSMESDRIVVENLVKDLFYEASDPIGEFNRFVNEDLSAHIISRVGSQTRIPYRHCLLLFLPLGFSAAANVFACDGMQCDVAARIELGEGATAATQLTTNAASWVVGFLLVYPPVYPAMLKLMDISRRRLSEFHCIHVATDIVIVMLCYIFMGFHEGFAAGLINVASSQMVVGIKRDVLIWTAIVVFYLAFLIFWAWHLFAHRAETKKSDGTTRYAFMNRS